MATQPPDPAAVTVNQFARPGLDTAPATVHEIITRQKVDALSERLAETKAEISGELGEIRLRVNGLIFVVIAAVVVQIVMRAMGA